MPSSVATPARWRRNSPKLWKSEQWDKELWDDYASSIYVTTTTSLAVPMPVKGVLEVLASGDLAGAGTLTLNLDGAPVRTSTVTGAATAVIVAGLTGVTVAKHTLTLTSGVGITNPQIVARRGRVPST